MSFTGFLDDLIVRIFTAILRGVIAAGAVLVYVQFLMIVLVLGFLSLATVFYIVHHMGAAFS